MTFRVGIDAGGTFTDLVAVDLESGGVRVAKVPSSREQPASAILAALSAAGIEPDEVGQFIHGTTVATNAMLERTGARVALLTTQGFTDIPFIQRIRRRYHYDLMWQKPRPLVRREDCLGITERMDATGQVVMAVQSGDIRRAAEHITKHNIESVAVCGLFSYLNPKHEQQIRDELAELLPNLPISISSDLSPVWREYERVCTTLADAYLRPLMTRYVADLVRELTDAGVAIDWSIMKSNGGRYPAKAAAENPVQTVLSGPAGGMIACQRLASRLDHPRIVTLDMGGTSCDVSVVDNGQVQQTTDFEVQWGMPVNVPVIDIKTIGAGGGSIAWLDAGGLLHVGPQSAGANPGPICYDRGGKLPTVTDANAMLGRVAPHRFVDGDTDAAMNRANRAMTDLSVRLGLSEVEAALAVIDIANANMADAVKLITLEQGQDPRTFALLAFGGAGPLHAAAIARSLGMKQVIVPPMAGMFSALGMLVADVRVDRVQTLSVRSDQLDEQSVRNRLDQLIDDAMSELRSEGFTSEPHVFVQAAMRYEGQNHELDVSVDVDTCRESGIESLFEQFHQQHELRYGYRMQHDVIELVAFKATVVGPTQTPTISAASPEQDGQAHERRHVFFRDIGWVETPVYRRMALPVEQPLIGPMVIEDNGATTLVEPEQRVTCRADGVLMITVNVEAASLAEAH